MIAMLLAPVLVSVPFVKADPATVLTGKWTRSGLGTNWESGLVIGDINGDGAEEIVYSGYNLTNSANRRISVLNGTNGNILYSWYSTRIGAYTQPQLYDVDGDGVLDMLVPLFYLPGLAAVKYDGVGLSTMWITNTQGQFGSGSIMAKPVAGDIDRDGNLDIFVASQDVSPLGEFGGGYDGTIVRLNNIGEILATTFTWRACSGGLSLGDTDNDGVFELYQGDRDMDYLDGGYGKGVKSYWAENLTERWIRLDDLTSAQAPVLADVTGDGIKDVITGMSRNQWVLSSSNGQSISYWTNNALSVHYGTTIYDIDGDGHLELLSNNGDNDNDAYTDVFDLVTGSMNAQLSLAGGDWKWSPLVADIDPDHPGMEIISCPNGTSINGWRGVIMIWDNAYNSIQNVTYSMSTQLGFPVVQDIDGDGLLELVAHASSGSVYAFDTFAPAPTGDDRLRSEVTSYGEDRLGVAQHTFMPGAQGYWTAPLVAPVSPADNALAVPIRTFNLAFQLRDEQSDTLTYSVTTNPNIGSLAGSKSSGTDIWFARDVSISGPLDYDTTYTWTVTANDGSEVTSRTYTFRTELAPNPSNVAPAQGTPSISPSGGGHSTSDLFEAHNQTTSDSNGDAVSNIYRWKVNSDSAANLLLPFNTRDETLTKDYSGFGNDGVVKGATWVPNGIVGGAYSFDGKDDAIVISDGGLGYFNDVDNAGGNPNHEELGGYGTWDEITVEAWIYLTKYNYGSRILAKTPSYALGFQSGYTNRLYCAVWPYTGEIAQDPNNATLDREARIYSNVNINLNTWYHIAFTYENGVGLKLYFNGALVNQGSTTEGPIQNSRGEPIYIGRLVQPFAGMIDEVKLYPFSLPAAYFLNSYLDTRNGRSTVSHFVPSAFSESDKLSCEIIPSDSYTDGTAKTSSTIILGDRDWVLSVDKLTSWYWNDDTTINSVEEADVDGDGAVEIITGGYYFDGVRDVAQLVVWNGATMAVENIRTWYWTGNTRINSLAVGNVDSDGAIEIVTAGYYNDGQRDVAQLVVWNGVTMAVENITTWYWTDDTRINSLAVGNVDSDGAIEIITGGYYNDGVRDVAQLVVWNGATMAVENISTWYWTGDTRINSLAVGNVDSDGAVEIVTAGYYNDGVRDVAQLVVWNGATMAVENISTWYWTDDTRINAVTIADTDGDDAEEIVTAGYYTDGSKRAQLVIWNSTTMAVENIRAWYWTADTEINSIAVGNVDIDSDLEIITGGYYNDNTRDCSSTSGLECTRSCSRQYWNMVLDW